MAPEPGPNTGLFSVCQPDCLHTRPALSAELWTPRGGAASPFPPLSRIHRPAAPWTSGGDGRQGRFVKGPWRRREACPPGTPKGTSQASASAQLKASPGGRAVEGLRPQGGVQGFGRGDPEHGTCSHSSWLELFSARPSPQRWASRTPPRRRASYRGCRVVKNRSTEGKLSHSLPRRLTAAVVHIMGSVDTWRSDSEYGPFILGQRNCGALRVQRQLVVGPN